MVRTAAVILVFLVALPALLLPALPGGAAEELKDNVYVVRPGDTLSGIAGRYLGDPKRWPEILKTNPQVTRGELIFPGDSLVLPLPEPEAIAISTGSEEAPTEAYTPLPVTPPPAEEVTAAEAEPPIPDLPVEIFRPEPVVAPATYRSAGYISATLPEAAIVAAPYSKISLAEGDEVILGIPAEEGTAFTVLRPTRKVYHPRTGEYLGWLVRVLGWAEVTCRGEGSSRAVLTSTVDVVTVGDLVAPFDPGDMLEDDSLGRKQTRFCLGDAEGGYIVASQENKVNIGDGDIVFLDRGRGEGVEPGDQFVVYKRIMPGQIAVIGQVQVLKVGDRTSTALVINSIREIAVADPVQAWEPEDSSGS